MLADASIHSHITSCLACRSIHIVALGSECPGGVGPGEEIMGQGQLQGGLLWSYLGHGALVGPCDLESSLHNPAFMEYTSRVFGDVTVVVRDCPSWVRAWRFVCVQNRLKEVDTHIFHPLCAC